MTDGDAYDRLSNRIPADRLEAGARNLERLHSRVREFVCNRLGEPLDDSLDHGYASWHVMDHSPALEAIASEGWPQRHLRDFALLAESPALGDCCRATVVELFGVEAFHVAVQFFPCSDGLVRSICHAGGEKRRTAERIAGELTNYLVANGSYPPPGQGLGTHVSPHSAPFWAIPVR